MKQHAVIALNNDDDGVPEEKIVTGIAFDVREKAVEGASPEHSWPNLGIALGVGVLIGCVLACRSRS